MSGAAALTAATAPTAYADLLVLQGALAGAGPGDSFVYAAGPALDRDHPVVQLVARLRGEGRVRTHIGGRDHQQRLRYLVTVLPAPDAPPALPPRAQLRPGEGELLELLRELQAEGRPCPSDAELAQILKLQDRHAAGYRLRRLAQLGLVKISNPAPRTRVVEVLK